MTTTIASMIGSRCGQQTLQAEHISARSAGTGRINMRLAITGHRPEKLPQDLDEYISVLTDTLFVLGPSYMYQGMAPGADLLAAYAAFQTGKLPFEAVIPYAGHRDMMKTDYWRSMWDSARHYAEHVEVLSDSLTYPGHWCMHNRNRYMVDHADQVLALWDGSEDGGTWSTVKYARSKGKPINIIDAVDLEVYFADY
jgi:hypothetical protein